jgi:hypothetical protein
MDQLIKALIPLLGVLIGFLLANWQRRIGYHEKHVNDFIVALENYYLVPIHKSAILRLPPAK